MMTIRPIRSDSDYRMAMQEVERYFDDLPEPGTPDGDRFDVLTTLVEVYESEHEPIPDADPVDILQFAIDCMGRSQAELSTLLGSRSRASEILSRKRALNLEQIRRISEAWTIPIASLTPAYSLQREPA